MTIFDLLFLACVLAGIITLIVAILTRSRQVLLELIAGTATYLVMVYSATLFSKPAISPRDQPLCNDDWCIAVDESARSGTACDVKLRIFSRARRVGMREASAKDVYLIDDHWNRYAPVHRESDVPLNTFLQPGQSVETERHFEVPASVHVTGLKVDYGSNPASLCLVIGECDAFHKGKMIGIE